MLIQSNSNSMEQRPCAAQPGPAAAARVRREKGPRAAGSGPPREAAARGAGQRVQPPGPGRQQRCHCAKLKCSAASWGGCCLLCSCAAEEQFGFCSWKLRCWQTPRLGLSLRSGVRVRDKISSFHPCVRFFSHKPRSYALPSIKSHKGLGKEALAENKGVAALAQPRHGGSGEAAPRPAAGAQPREPEPQAPNGGGWGRRKDPAARF